MGASEPNTGFHPLPGLDNSYSASEATTNHVVFKGGRIYQHHVLRVNYTTYDVKRGQDNFNPNSQHRDIMMLAEKREGESRNISDRFCYARIVGIYHANVQYIGPGVKDYNPRRLNFLHVRWFDPVPSDAQHGVALDMLRLSPMNAEDAYGFIDPADVLRGCHIIPAFAKGQMRPADAVTSPLSKDSYHWKYYYINK